MQAADSDLTVGITVPFFDHQSDYATIVELARQVEDCGYDSIWMADHISRRTPFGAGRWYEVLTLLAGLAGQVDRISLGTDVLVAPYRHPVLCAKMLATLDVVSGGRLIVGTGVGYIESEFADLSVPYAQRGPYTTEAISIWRKIWAGGPIDHQGRFFSFSALEGNHVPVQRPGPPVWIGGTADAVLKRVIEVGDGWHPISLPIAVLRDKVKRLREFAELSGRTRPITLSYSGGFGTVGVPAEDVQRRLPLTGGTDDVLRDIEELREMGFSNIVFRFGTAEASNDDVRRQVDIVADTILPRLRD